MQKPILIMFGGVSPEHEVSVITGLQIIENIDRNLYDIHPFYITKQGEFEYIENLSDRKQFLSAKRKPLTWGRDKNGGFIEISGLRAKKIYPQAVYLAFHGGIGESGPIQGLLETLEIAHTSSSQEASVITMNKQLTKEVVAKAGINVVEGLSLFSKHIREDSQVQTTKVIKTLHLPVIIKPVHLGSSIAIKIAKTEVELEKYLLEAAFVDNEVLVERLLTNFTEYNCSVRAIDGKLEVSEIERPKSQDEILSFADKYQRGNKKTCGSGMTSLQRELPAKINHDLKQEIQEAAKKAFVTCRCKGMVRIDFMYTKSGGLFLTEINPIPGSMAFYLWEASGISFKQQITDLLEQSIRDAEVSNSTNLDYHSDIVEEFVNAQ